METEIVRDCLAFLKLYGIFAWRNNSGTSHNGKVRYGLVGSSDIIGILPDGRFLAIECKYGKGKTTPEQDAFLAEITRNGGEAFIARSVDDVQKWHLTTAKNAV